MIAKDHGVTARPRKTWPQFVSAFMLNDLAAMMKKSGIDSPHDALPVETFRDIMELLYEDHIDRKTARLAVQWAIERHQEVRDFLRFVSERMKAEAAK